MKIWRLPDQVIRLLVLFAVALAALIGARILFVPKSFGKIGHYRADAVEIIAAQPIQFAGWQVCIECHEDEGKIKNASYHRSLACEVCHGPAYEHTQDPLAIQPPVPRKRGEACLYCHSYLSSRPTGFPQIIERSHNPMEPCISCHDPHDPAPPETPEACSACHAQIARTKAISHHAALDCETCHETPAKHKEAPRASLAKKPTQRSVCGACHAAGSAAEPRIPQIELATHGGGYLCWQCHYPHFPES